MRWPLQQILKICENPNFVPLFRTIFGGTVAPHLRPPWQSVHVTGTVLRVLWWNLKLHNQLLKYLLFYPSSNWLCKCQSRYICNIFCQYKIHQNLIIVQLSNTYLLMLYHLYILILFRNKKFMLDEMTWQNASKFAKYMYSGFSNSSGVAIIMVSATFLENY